LTVPEDRFVPVVRVFDDSEFASKPIRQHDKYGLARPTASRNKSMHHYDHSEDERGHGSGAKLGDKPQT
jgi:hypothetical protein